MYKTKRRSIKRSRRRSLKRSRRRSVKMSRRRSRSKKRSIKRSKRRSIKKSRQRSIKISRRGSTKLTSKYIKHVLDTYIPQQPDGLNILKYRRKDIIITPLAETTDKSKLTKEEISEAVKQLKVQTKVNKKILKDAQHYFDSIYYDPEIVVKKIGLSDKNLKLINEDLTLTSDEKEDLTYIYIYQEEKEKFDKNYKEALHYIENNFNKKEFKKMYDEYYFIDKINDIRESKFLKPDYKEKLILIELYNNVLKDKKIGIQEAKNYESLAKYIGKYMNEHYQSAMDYLNIKYRYTDYVTVEDYINHLFIKYKDNKTLKDIKKQNLSDEIIYTLSIILFKILEDQPTEENIQLKLQNNLEKTIKYSIEIPSLGIGTKYKQQKINEKYHVALEYFVNKYKNNSTQKIESLQKRYEKELKTNTYKEKVIEVCEIDKLESDAIDKEYKKALKHFENKVDLDDHIARTQSQIKNLIDLYIANTYYSIKDSGIISSTTFNVKNFHLDKDINKKIVTIITYKREKEIENKVLLDNYKKIQDEKKKIQDEKIRQKAEEEKNKLDFLNERFKQANNYFDSVYGNNKALRLAKLKSDYKEHLKFIYNHGMRIRGSWQVLGYLYTDLYNNTDVREKVTTYFLYTKELEEKQIQKNYETAMKYFEKEYPTPTQQMIGSVRLFAPPEPEISLETETTDPDEKLIKDIENSAERRFVIIKDLRDRYKTLLSRYHDDYNYSKASKLKYDIYRLYLYDVTNKGKLNFTNIIISIIAAINYIGNAFTKLLDIILQIIYRPVSAYYTTKDFFNRLWYGERTALFFKKPVDQNTLLLKSTNANIRVNNKILEAQQKNLQIQTTQNALMSTIVNNYGFLLRNIQRVCQDLENSNDSVRENMVNLVDKFDSLGKSILDLSLSSSISKKAIEDLNYTLLLLKDEVENLSSINISLNQSVNYPTAIPIAIPLNAEERSESVYIPRNAPEEIASTIAGAGGERRYRNDDAESDYYSTNADDEERYRNEFSDVESD